MSEPAKDLSELEIQPLAEDNDSEGDPVLLKDIPWNVPFFIPEWSPSKKAKAKFDQKKTPKLSNKQKGVRIFEVIK